MLARVAGLTRKGLDIGSKLRHTYGCGIPGEHETRATADERVKTPSPLTQPFEHGFRCLEKHGIGLRRKHQGKSGQCRDPLCQRPGAVITVLAVTQPGAALQQTDPGRRNKAHFRGQLPCLLAAIIEALGECRIEEQNRFSDSHAVLCAAETQHVYSGLPCHLGRRAAQSRAGIGEAGAIHMQAQPQFAAGLGNRAYFCQRIDLTRLGRLGDRHDLWLGIVDIAATGRQRPYIFGKKLGVIGAGHQQFGAVGKEFRRAAFIGLDMGKRRTDDAVIGLAERGERQRIGGCAVEGKEHLALRTEQGTEAVRSAVGPFIVAISRNRTRIGLLHHIPDFGTDTGIIITGKLLGHGRESFLDVQTLRTKRGCGLSRDCRSGHISSVKTEDTTLPGSRLAPTGSVDS